jgi:hypothetical protein
MLWAFSVLDGGCGLISGACVCFEAVAVCWVGSHCWSDGGLVTQGLDDTGELCGVLYNPSPLCACCCCCCSPADFHLLGFAGPGFSMTTQLFEASMLLLLLLLFLQCHVP